MSRIRTASLALALSLTVAIPVAAQGIGQDPLTPRTAGTPLNTVPMMVGGTIGSFAGLWAGLYLAANYDGEGSLLLLPSLLGASALGTALGIDLGSGGDVAFSDALGAALLGTLGGVGAAYLVGSSDQQGWGGIMLGYSIGQGTLAGLVSSMTLTKKGAGVP